MAGTKISEATLREQLKGTENIPIVDTDLPKGRTTVEKLKEYIGAGGVGEDVSGKEFTIDGEQVTAKGGAEVFNKGGGGNPNIAVGTKSHAEGFQTTAHGPFSHTEGQGTKATKTAAHAEGNYTQATGEGSHSEGFYSEASGRSSHAEGEHTKATNTYEHAEGTFNKSNNISGDTSGSTIHSIGIGTSENDRKNAFEVMQNGDAYLYGAGGYDGTNPGGEGVKTVQTQLNEIGGKMDKAGGEFTGTIAAPIVAFMRESKGMMAAIQADSNNILFRTYNAGVDSITFQVQSSIPLKLTEAGIWENNQLLENKYAKIDDVPDVSNLATKEELGGKVSGTGVTQIQAVTALPESPADGVLYIITAAEETEETA